MTRAAPLLLALHLVLPVHAQDGPGVDVRTAVTDSAGGSDVLPGAPALPEPPAIEVERVDVRTRVMHQLEEARRSGDPSLIDSRRAVVEAPPPAPAVSRPLSPGDQPKGRYVPLPTGEITIRDVDDLDRLQRLLERARSRQGGG